MSSQVRRAPVIIISKLNTEYNKRMENIIKRERERRGGSVSGDVANGADIERGINIKSQGSGPEVKKNHRCPSTKDEPVTFDAS